MTTTIAINEPAADREQGSRPVLAEKGNDPVRCFLSELQVPEDGDSLPWACCKNCRRRKNCPIACDLDLRSAARRRHAAARLLKETADRLLEAISRADNVGCLLDADEAVERALSRALCQEISRNDDFCTSGTTRSI